ncbi:carbohydrate kinase family protein [candidate division WWE3 bacterium]|jgi:sugar/nucleoside kinase (ribokinase family)|uniref:Carbohydrate kinase family protein n=1 Tax=candidate division WWE3 bacterium TaxID=2053526 RepID=A0A3A4ZD18_UNCKA|nr:MAG: carbohydrate kinase family protein [candidate division WWE3 bacterium]
MNKLDLLTIGDSSIDLFMKIGDNSGLTESADGSSEKFCFFHGSKIPVESFETSVAGNAINVAIGAKLLKLNAAVYTELGDDANTDRIISELKSWDINTDFCKKNKDTPTDLHTIIVFKGERTIFSYHGKRQYTLQDWPQPKYIYYTSMPEGFESFQHELIEYISKHRGTGLAFNPGTIHMKTGLAALRDILKVTDILFVNKEEAQRLTESALSGEELHKKLAELGPKLSVITDGSSGSSAYDGIKITHQGIYDDGRPVEDMTGAGDSFSAGFMAAIVHGKSLETALKWGTINASANIKVIGSFKGLLTIKEIESINI